MEEILKKNVLRSQDLVIPTRLQNAIPILIRRSNQVIIPVVLPAYGLGFQSHASLISMQCFSKVRLSRHLFTTVFLKILALVRSALKGIYRVFLYTVVF